MIQQSTSDARSTLCMILLYGTWYDILGMIYSSAAAYFIAIRSQFRMRRTYRKQREERETKREPERVRESSLSMSRGNSLSDELEI